MFSSAFKAWTDVGYDFYPEELRAEIDRINELVYSHFNNGVYRAASPGHRKPTKKRREEYFTASILWKVCSQSAVTWLASASPRRIGGFFRLCYGLIWSTTAISSAISAAFKTTRIWLTIYANFINGPESKTLSIYKKLSRGTTAKEMSIQPALCPWGRPLIIWITPMIASACRLRHKGNYRSRARWGPTFSMLTRMITRFSFFIVSRYSSQFLCSPRTCLYQ